MSVPAAHPKSPAEVLLARAKIGLHQARRLVEWTARPGHWARPPLATGDEAHDHLLYERSMPLHRLDPDAHPLFEAGKRVNLALAAPWFDGLRLSPAAPLSFWRTVGRLTRARGYRDGMELRGGCIVPALGGGICLLSNALFAMAADLGWTILERHGHSMEAVAPEPGALWGMDATVLWPYVDLRVAPRLGSVRLGVRVAAGRLVVSAHGDRPMTAIVALREEADTLDETARGRVRRNRIIRTIDGVDEVLCVNEKRLLHASDRRRNCYSCGEESCHDRPRGLPLVR